MKTGAAIALYNQGRLEDPAFVADFVARHETFDALLEVLRLAARGGDTGHQVLIGARGMGKTSLLRRVAIGIGEDALLRDTFAPLRFREEQYNVIALDAFWRNCGEALAEWCETNKYNAEADELDRAIETPEWRDADKAATAFLGYCARIGRRACLLVDNLDLILDNLGKQESRSLLHVLQRADGPVVIGAATQMLRQGTDRAAPFYAFFHPVMLEPLDEAELVRCMRALADRRGAAGEPVRQVLASSPERIRTLYALTGGNPRIVKLIYQLLERAETNQIFDDLEALLDQVTPFYKARIEEYTSVQQRALIDAIGLNWDPITSGALSKASGIKVTTISSLLDRLRKDGLIEQVETSGARDGYQFSERFLNIWYLMRHGTRKTRQRLKWLTKFLARLFSPEELGEMAARAPVERSAGRWNAIFCEAIGEALQEAIADRSMDTASTISAAKQSDRSSTALGSAPEARDTAKAEVLLEQAWQHFEAKRFDVTLKILDELLHRFDASDVPALPELIATALVNKGVTLGALGHPEQEIATYDGVETRFGASDMPALQEHVAIALLNKGVSLGMLGRFKESLAAYDAIETRFGASEVTTLKEQVAKALLNKGVRLATLGRSEEALAAYDAVEVRFGASDVSALQEQVAKALLNKGIRLGLLGRSEQAIATYETIEARYGASEVTALREQVAKALFSKGVRLGLLGHPEEAIAAYDAVEAHFGASEVAALQEQVAMALVNKGVSLGELGRSEEAIVTYDAVVARFGASEVPALQKQVAMALLNRGIRLGVLGRSDEAIVAYDAVEARFGASEVASLQERVAKALINKGVRLGVLGRSAEAIAVYDSVEARFGASEVTALQEQVAMALINKGARFSVLGRSEEAIAAYDAVEARFGASEMAALQDPVAGALLGKALTLGVLGRSEEAIAAYDAVEARFGASGVMALRERVAAALFSKGVTLGALGRSEEAIVAYDAVDARFGASDVAALQKQVAMALVNKGVRLGALGRSEEALAVHDAVEARFGASKMTAFQKQVAMAKVNKGVEFDALGRSEEAVAIWDTVIAHFSETPEADMHEPVIAALQLKGRMGINLGHYPPAETSLRRALSVEPDVITTANLIWALIAQGKAREAGALQIDLTGVAAEGLALIDAGIELAQDNFGNAFDHLTTALAVGLEEGASAFFEDLIWLLRIGADRGHGERLIDWFESSGNHERYAPIHAALVAYVRGERFLLDVNPEVRGTAQKLFAKMSAHRKLSDEKAGKRGTRKGGGRTKRG